MAEDATSVANPPAQGSGAFAPWAAIEQAALDAFAEHLNVQSPNLAAVLRRAPRYAQIDRQASEIVVDRRAVLLALIGVGLADTPSLALGNTATWFADWLRRNLGPESLRPIQDGTCLTGTDQLHDAFAGGFRLVASATMREIAATAARHAMSTISQDVAHMRHLFAAMLPAMRSFDVLPQLGDIFAREGAGLRRELFDRIALTPEPGENLEAWREILGLEHAAVRDDTAVAELERVCADLKTRPSEALRQLFDLAGRLAPQRRSNNDRITTSLLVFAAAGLGARQLGEGDGAALSSEWVYLRDFSATLRAMAGAKYGGVSSQYFAAPPDLSLGGEAPPIERFSDNTVALLRRASKEFVVDGAPLDLLRVEACLLALLQTPDANALRNLRLMGVDPVQLREKVPVFWRAHPRPAPNTQFVADDAEAERDELGRGVLAIAFARRLHRIWCTLNDALPPEPRPRATRQAPLPEIEAALPAERRATRDDTGPKAPRDEARAAFVVHLDAPWGGGKTTFTNFLARVLNPYGFDQGSQSFLRQRYGDAQEKNLGAIFLDDPPSEEGRAARTTEPNWPLEARRPWIVVPFNAWQVEHCAPPWWVFYQTIRSRAVTAILREGNAPVDPQAMTPPARPPFLARLWLWLALWLQEYAWRLWNPKVRTLFATALVSAAILYLLYLLGIVAPSGKPEDPKLGFYLGSGVGLVLAGISAIGAIWGLGALFTESIVPGTDTLAERLSLGGGDPFERFRRHFQKLMTHLARPVMVIVDDLDRCKPDFIVDLVRGIQTLLRSPRVVFVILGDRDWIERAFEAHHQAMSKVSVGAEQSFGARFVEKAIQMSFILPGMAKAAQAEYVRWLLLGRRVAREDASAPVAAEDADHLRQIIRDQSALQATALETKQIRDDVITQFQREAPAATRAEERPKLVQFVNDELAIRAAFDRKVEEEVSHRLEPLAEYFPANPRQIKRIINAVTMYHAVALQQRGLEPSDPRWFQLARWVIIMTEWPHSWRLLASYPVLADLIAAPQPEEAIAKLDAASLPGSIEATLKEVARIKADATLFALLTRSGGEVGAPLDRGAIEDFLALTPLHARKARLGEEEAKPAADTSAKAARET